MTLYQFLLQFFRQVTGGLQENFAQMTQGNPQTWTEKTFAYLGDKGIYLQDSLSKGLSALVVIALLWVLYKVLKKTVSYFSVPFFASFFARFLKLDKQDKDELAFLRKFNEAVSFATLYLFLEIFLPDEGNVFSLVYTIWENLIIWQVIRVSVFLISRLYYLPSLQVMRETIPLKGILQSAGLLLYGIGVIAIFLHFANLNLSGFLAGIGAVSAVLLLIFQDSLLNLTATFKIYSNKMLKVGDWIEIPSMNCEGIVEDVTLGIIKVQNFDMSVSSFSPKTLVAGTFKNWSNMVDKQARRSTQLLWLDLHSVANLSQEQLNTIRLVPALADFWREEGEAIVEAHATALSNVHLFRSYFLYYLKNHALIHSDMAIYVRNREVTDKGLPLQILFYSRRVLTQDFEEIQADILEHAFAIIREFYLNPYQTFSNTSAGKLT